MIVLNLISIIACVGKYIYNENLPTNRGDMFSGIESLFLFFKTMIIYWVNIIMFYIVVISKIIVFEKKQKTLGKTYKNSLILIIASILLGMAVSYIFKDIYNNHLNIKGKGKVTSIEEIEEKNSYDINGNHVIDWRYTVEFEVNGKKYNSEKILSIKKPKFKVGDIIDIVYRKSKYYEGGSVEEDYYITHSYYNYGTYIPALIIAVMLLIIRFAPSNKIQKTNNIDQITK